MVNINAFQNIQKEVGIVVSLIEQRQDIISGGEQVKILNRVDKVDLMEKLACKQKLTKQGGSQPCAQVGKSVTVSGTANVNNKSGTAKRH